MHSIDGYAEVESGLTLPVFNPNKLITTKEQLRLAKFSRQETVLRYCRYSSRTFDLLGIKHSIELSERVFEKIAETLGAVVTPHRVGVVEYLKSTEDNFVWGSKLKDNLMLVQEVDIVRPSVNIARHIQQHHQCEVAIRDQQLQEIAIDGFTYGAELNASQYVFGTTKSERAISQAPALHHVDLEYYISPTVKYLIENHFMDNW